MRQADTHARSPSPAAPYSLSHATCPLRQLADLSRATCPMRQEPT